MSKLEILASKNMHEHIQNAIEILREGGIVIFPTDTAFALSCRIDSVASVEKLFSIRRRPVAMAVPVLFDSLELVKDYVTDIPQAVENDLIQTYWPGALTVILSADLQKIPSLVRGGGVTVGTRIPDHAIPMELISNLRVPLVGTSANFHGGETPYTVADINPELLYLADYLVPGTTSLGKESTVVDCTVTPWEIKRQGAIELGDIRT